MARTVSIRGRTRGGVRGPVKSAQGERTIPISGDLAKALTAHRLASVWSADADYVVATRNGTARYQCATYRILREATAAARVPWCGG